MLPMRYQSTVPATPVSRFFDYFFDRFMGDRFFADNFWGPAWSTLARPTWSPMNVRDAGDAYEVELAAPGINPEQFDIQIQRGLVTVRVQQQSQQETERDGYLLREMSQGALVRSVQLPAEIDADHAEATYEHGVLKLRLPKVESARPRQITVKTS